MFDPLPLLKEYGELREELSKSAGPVSVTGCMSSQKIELVSGLMRDRGWVLYICRDEKALTPAFNDFKNFEDNAFIYPAKDLLFYSSDIRGGYITNERMEALKHLVEDKKGVLVATVDSLMDKISPRERLSGQRLRLFESMVIDPEELSKVLSSMAYKRVPQVEIRGEYSVRGGIIDIYPVTEEQPEEAVVEASEQPEADATPEVVPAAEPEAVTAVPAEESEEELGEDLYTDYSPEAVVRRAAWNKGLRCRRNYGPHNIPVAFVKGKVAVFVDEPGADTSVDAELEAEGWTVIRYDATTVTDGKAQGEEIAAAVKANLRSSKSSKRKSKK